MDSKWIRYIGRSFDNYHYNDTKVLSRPQVGTLLERE